MSDLRQQALDVQQATGPLDAIRGRAQLVAFSADAPLAHERAVLAGDVEALLAEVARLTGALRLVHEQDCNCDDPGGPRCYSQSIGALIAAGSGSVTG